MLEVSSIADCRAACRDLGSVALVPTMGALHEGHLSLIRIARRHAPRVAVSLFVNPTQFGPHEDLSRYPRTPEQDLRLCAAEGVDLVFMPEASAMYPPGAPQATIDVPALSETLEGRHRPGHFRGVCQVVAKLFNIVQPVAACFGQKDFQQLRVVEAMVRSLDMPIAVVRCPTVREPDGLAMSSRNRYLSADERKRALSISRALRAAAQEFDAGARQGSRLVATMRAVLLDPSGHGRVPFSIDYLAAADAETLATIDEIDRPVVCAIAARVGNTRLIDNVLLAP